MIRRFVASVGQATYTVELLSLGVGRWRVIVDGRESVVDAHQVASGAWSILLPEVGTAHLFDVAGSLPELTVSTGETAVVIKLVDERKAALARASSGARDSGGPQKIVAPIPGKVVKVLVTKGQAVTAGQGIVIVEAMKMENELRAMRDGTLLEMEVKEGQTVEAGQVLATVG